MIEDFQIPLLVTALILSIGFNFLFWSLIGLLRFLSEAARMLRRRRGFDPVRQGIGLGDVAVIIPAHNEQATLPKCLAALTRGLPPSQIYVASDGSKDRTVDIARDAGCHVCDIHPNGGKARAIQRAIDEFALCEQYRAILIMDADSEIDPGYFQAALPLFDDPRIAVVAGHVRSRWTPGHGLGLNMLFAAYRTRLYCLLQAVFKYGQSWGLINVNYIAPGVGSLYRASVLADLEITAQGLVIEDFNMTFEVQRRGLGRVAYTPRARCSSEDPFRLGDYRRQVQRWYLGFWQTVRRHGLWPSVFWLSLALLLAELIVLSLVTLLLPVAVLLHLIIGMDVPALVPVEGGIAWVSPLALLLVVVGIDYALTVLVACIERRPELLLFGLAFPALRVLDAALLLIALLWSFRTNSDGHWTSPQRLADARPSPPSPVVETGPTRAKTPFTLIHNRFIQEDSHV